MCIFVLKVSAGRTYTCTTVETGRTVLAPYLKLWCNVKSPRPPWNSWELLYALHSSFIDTQVQFTYSGPFRSHLVLQIDLTLNSDSRSASAGWQTALDLGLQPPEELGPRQNKTGPGESMKPTLSHTSYKLPMRSLNSASCFQ